MIKIRRKTSAFYRYTASYFTVLFLLTAVIIIAAMRWTTDKLVSMELRRVESSMQQAADFLEKQYDVLESIAMNISIGSDYRPNRVARDALSELEMLEDFKTYVNYSTLAERYFLVYRTMEKLYTSTGNTAYFPYYAPANLAVAYPAAGEIWQKLMRAADFALEYSGDNILAVFPIRFYNYDHADTNSASLCFILTREQISRYINLVSAGLPQRYAVSLRGHFLYGQGDQTEAMAESEDARLRVTSSGEKVSITAQADLAGWQILLSDNTVLIYISLFSCALVLAVSLLMAHFTLMPLNKLIKKYTPMREKVENEFRELDGILDSLQQRHSESRYQLRNHLLISLLRGGEYNERLIQRWSVLGVTFNHPLCCVYLLDQKLPPERYQALSGAIRGMCGPDICLYTAEIMESNTPVIISNYRAPLTHEEVLRRIEGVAGERGLKVWAGQSVDSPKRLPLSFMAAMTASSYDAAEAGRSALTAHDLAERMLEAIATGSEAEQDDCCRAIADFLRQEPLGGVITKKNFYELVSHIFLKADEKGLAVNKAAINALVLLPDTGMIAGDLKAILHEAVCEEPQTLLSGDDTAKLIVEYVIANAYDPDINLQSMSETFGLSADYISTMIKKETGSAFKEYVTLLRIGEARRLLIQDKSLTVNDVALKVGYRKASNFSRKFKELTGKLPSESR